MIVRDIKTILEAYDINYTKISCEDSVNYIVNEVKNTLECDFETCKNCVFFDGYDVCWNVKNFGSVTKKRKMYCKNNNLFELSVLN